MRQRYRTEQEIGLVLQLLPITACTAVSPLSLNGIEVDVKLPSEVIK
jgi:hypothetical protein